MSCRCGERRTLLAAGGNALLRADAKTAAQSARTITQSLGADARRVLAALTRPVHPPRRP